MILQIYRILIIVFIFVLLSGPCFSTGKPIELSDRIIWQINWVNKNEIYIVDGTDSWRTTRIIKCDVLKRKLFPVYNSDFKIKDTQCRVSYDGKYFGIYNFKEDKVIIIHKGKIIYKAKLRELLNKQVSQGIISAYHDFDKYNMGQRYMVNNNSIIIMLGRFDPSYGGGIEYLVDLNYKKGKINNIVDLTKGQFKKHCCKFIPKYSRYEIESPRFIFMGIGLLCYDIQDHILRDFSPQNLKNKKLYGPLDSIQTVGNNVFYYWNKVLYKYNVNKGTVNKIPLPREVENSIKKYIVNKKYLLLFCVHIKNSDRYLQIYLYRAKDFKPIKSPSLDYIVEKNIGIMSISPFEGKAFSYDWNKMKPLFYEIHH